MGGYGQQGMRVIGAESFYDLKDANGGTTSEAATKALQAASKEITIKIGDGSQTEGEYFKGLFDSGNSPNKTPAGYKEMSATLLFDAENATLTVHTNSSKKNGPNWSFTDDPNTIPGVKDGKVIAIGDAHTPQIADLYPDFDRAAISQMRGDGNAAAEDNRNLFTIDSKNVDAFKLGPKGINNKPSVSPMDNIANTQDLHNNKFSILRTALEYFGGK